MFFKLQSAAPCGLDCVPVDVEVDLNKGQTNFSIVGLADTSIKEAKDRLYSALKNSGFDYPFNFRILINLAPADLQKEGPLYDLAMAVGLIAVSTGLTADLSDALFVGELGLDGTVRHVNGVLPITMFAQSKGFKRIFVPSEDACEAGLCDGIEIFPVKNLRQIISHITKVELVQKHINNAEDSFSFSTYDLDMAFIKGQDFAKRAMEIAASGSHNISMTGPPGSGKTLLARTLPSILPRLSRKEALEVTKIYSVAGALHGGIARERPFRSPHHTASSASLVGGGRNPRPGEISLAHRGVLFLDEMAEFPRFVLEALRQPLEDGIITIARANGTLTFPARFILVGSQNPCPCGYASDPDRQCICSASQILNYGKKISGPLLDRIDLHVEVPRVKFDKLTSQDMAESSQKVRARVEVAREIQISRFSGSHIHANGEMGNAEIKEFCRLNESSLAILRGAVENMHLSARSYNRILKVARTIADLDKCDKIMEHHIAEALQFRPRTG